MPLSDWLIYGANGHTGRRIAREAVRRGMRPTLAGRNRPAIAALAQQLNCPWISFALDQPAQIARRLEGRRLVLHCAGPFSATAEPMLEACLLAGVHYLDITGEISVIEQAAACDQRARERGVLLLPAVGFDVVPSDCLAAMLARRLPDAASLQLALRGTFRPSRGTLRTMLEGLAAGTFVRREGRLVRLPWGQKTTTIPWPDGPRPAAAIPWGDVASAWYTTGIPNIEVYLALDRRRLALLRLAGLSAPVLQWRPLRAGMGALAGWFLTPRPGEEASEPTDLEDDEARLGKTTSRLPDNGAASVSARPSVRPTAGARETLPLETAIWGRVTNARQRSVQAVLWTIEPYRLTVLSALAAVERVAAGQVHPGFNTPARALGSDLALKLPGTRLEWL